MSSKTELPLDLLKANIELQARINRLVQQSGQQWLDFGNRLFGDGIAESDAEIAEALKVEGWQALATLPAEAFWRQWQQRFGDGQAAVQIAVGAQTMFANGLQDALRTWQKETAAALGNVGLAASSPDPAWAGLFKQWEQFLPAAAKAPAAKPAAATRGGRHG